MNTIIKNNLLNLGMLESTKLYAKNLPLATIEKFSHSIECVPFIYLT